MATKNLIEYGVSSIGACSYTVSDTGVVTLGTPVMCPGAKSIKLEEQIVENSESFDNITYYYASTNDGDKGSIEVAYFPDEFKKQFLGNVTLDDGGIGSLIGAKKTPVCIFGQFEGDAANRRFILYNTALGAISREFKSVEEGKIETATESIDIRVIGDKATKLYKAIYLDGSTGYDALFTTPPVPKLPTVAG